jgi:hypothetical protein
MEEGRKKVGKRQIEEGKKKGDESRSKKED